MAKTTTETPISLKALLREKLQKITESCKDLNLGDQFSEWNKGQLYVSGLLESAVRYQAPEEDVQLIKATEERISRKLDDIEAEGTLEDQLSD